MKPRSASLLALAVLLGLDVALFTPFLTGTRWFLGNPDRFNQYLTVLHAFGQVRSSWDPTIFGGWNIIAMPWFFPLGHESWLVGGGLGEFIHRTTLLSFGFFFLSGLAAWCFLRDLFRSPWLALTGAVLYQCAFASTLRITQNDQTFAVLALTPLLLLAARRGVHSGSPAALAGLFLGCAALVWLTFLQEAAYVALLLGAYLVFLTVSMRAWGRGLWTAACAGAGLAAGLPRMWLVGKELGQMIRSGGSRPFDELYEFQNIRPWEILRLFDDTIFGRSHAEVGLSNLNYSEGLQLFTAQAAPFLLLWLLLSRNGRTPGALPEPEKRFHLAIALTTVAVVCLKPAYHFVYLLFGRIDFYHTRVIVAGLLPMVTLVVAALARLLATTETPTSTPRGLTGAAVATGILVALAFPAMAALCQPAEFWHLPVGAWQWVLDANRTVHVFRPAVVMVLLSAGVVLAATLIARREQSGAFRRGAVVALAALTATQAALAARHQLQGSHTRGPIPFERGNSWHPDRDDFRPPTAAETASLHRQLEASGYRTAVVCSDPEAQGLLANSVARFYGMESIDGYGNGVPRNLAWLPWSSDALRLRQIHFTSAANLPWRTLALVGIKHAWVVDRRVFAPSPARFSPETILTNPLPPVPRAFFPARLIARLSAGECQAWMLALPEAPRLDVEAITVVRAGSAPIAGGAPADLLSYTAGPGTITLEVVPSLVDRFVVVNTRWHPGWSAEAEGKSLQVYEANGFMLGVSVPAHAATVQFKFNAISWAFTRSAPRPISASPP